MSPLPQPNLDVHSAVDFKNLTTDVDCGALWGAPSNYITIGGGGTLAVVKCNGITDSIDLTGYPAGHLVEFQAAKVLAAGTTCPKVVVYVTRQNPR